MIPEGIIYLFKLAGLSLKLHPPRFTAVAVVLYNSTQSELSPVLSSMPPPEFDAEYSFILTWAFALLNKNKSESDVSIFFNIGSLFNNLKYTNIK